MWYVFLMLLIMLSLFLLSKKIYIEKQQDLNLDKEFKVKKHFFYETCSICGKKLKHARFGRTGDVMYCTVECRGKTTWYCEKCKVEVLDKDVVYQNPLDYIGENNVQRKD